MTPENSTKPFPWTCFACGKRKVAPAIGPYSTRIKHDGTWYELEIPDFRAPKCAACAERQITEEADAQLRAALRAKVGLLSPEEIRGNRQALGLTQKDLGRSLGAAEETISRWETSALIQSRAMDNLLRVFFAFPQVRTAFGAASRDLGRRIDGRARSGGNAERGWASFAEDLAEILSRRGSAAFLDQWRRIADPERRAKIADGCCRVLRILASEPAPEHLCFVFRARERDQAGGGPPVRWIVSLAAHGEREDLVTDRLGDWLDALEAVPADRPAILRQVSALVRILAKAHAGSRREPRP